MPRKYIDFNLTKNFPNKYNLTPSNIKKLKILDWDKLKKRTWHNKAMTSGNWWCHLEGCGDPNKAIKGKYIDDDEFWIGFNEDNNKIDCNWSCFEGMCSYKFDKFYESNSIENCYDMNVQVNTIRWLNMMIDDGILGLR